MSKTPEIASPQQIELDSVLGMFFLKGQHQSYSTILAEKLQFFVFFLDGLKCFHEGLKTGWMSLTHREWLSVVHNPRSRLCFFSEKKSNAVLANIGEYRRKADGRAGEKRAILRNHLIMTLLLVGHRTYTQFKLKWEKDRIK
jgi:hypothetical protein